MQKMIMIELSASVVIRFKTTVFVDSRMQYLHDSRETCIGCLK